VGVVYSDILSLACCVSRFYCLHYLVKYVLIIQVPCGHTPSKAAKLPNGQSPSAGPRCVPNFIILFGSHNLRLTQGRAENLSSCNCSSSIHTCFDIFSHKVIRCPGRDYACSKGLAQGLGCVPETNASHAVPIINMIHCVSTTHSAAKIKCQSRCNQYSCSIKLW